MLELNKLEWNMDEWVRDMLFLSVIQDEVKRSQLEYLYTKYSKEMWFVANGILRDRHEAEDVVQTAFIKLADYLNEKIDLDCNKTKGLIVIIVRNLSFNIYRRRQRRPTVEIDQLDQVLTDSEESLPEIHVLRLDQVSEMAAKLAEIKPEYADVLAMKYTLEYTNEEISHLLNTTEGNVRIRLMRAKQALHKVMEVEKDDY